MFSAVLKALQAAAAGGGGGRAAVRGARGCDAMQGERGRSGEACGGAPAAAAGALVADGGHDALLAPVERLRRRARLLPRRSRAEPRVRLRRGAGGEGTELCTSALTTVGGGGEMAPFSRHDLARSSSFSCSSGYRVAEEGATSSVAGIGAGGQAAGAEERVEAGEEATAERALMGLRRRDEANSSSVMSANGDAPYVAVPRSRAESSAAVRRLAVKAERRSSNSARRARRSGAAEAAASARRTPARA